MPQIFGEVVRRTGKELLLSVAIHKGDAREFGLCGQVWFPLAQVRIFRDPASGLERLNVPTELALLKARSCQPCD